MQYKTKTLDPNFRKSFLEELEERNKRYEKVNGGQSNCMEIILDLCEKHEVEPESVNPILNRVIKTKIKEEAINMNLMKGKKKQKLF